MSLSLREFNICLISVRCTNSLANGNSNTILSNNCSLFSSVEKQFANFSTIFSFSIFIRVLGTIFKKIVGKFVFSSIFNPFEIYLSILCTPMTDCSEVDVTQYFFTLGSNNNGAEYSLIPALKSTRTASAPNFSAILESISAKIEK